MLFQEHEIRRIGLSATIADTNQAAKWLATGSNIPTKIILESSSNREIKLGIEFFSKKEEELELNSKDVEKNLFHSHLFNLTKNELKTLIFSNNRLMAENIGFFLKREAKLLNYSDFIYIHHGSISAELRKHTEKVMKNPIKQTCVSATVTLELGIDIGNLDQVLQIQSPNSVSSFLQRLGRSGRRDNPSKMFFYILEEKQLKLEIQDQIQWDLIQCIAIIQLYLDEKWIEPIKKIKYPFSLLYQQAMSIMSTFTELLPNKLAEKVLTIPIFRNISLDDFKVFILYLIKNNHLQKMKEGSLIVGLEGEKVINNFRFYATFQEELEFQVKEKSKSIGFIQEVPIIGTNILLAGK